MVGLHYYYRAITMFVTVLPVADEQYKCAPQVGFKKSKKLSLALKKVVLAQEQANKY